MTTLHLGVYDVPYAESPDGSTTGEVAQILEDKYHVIETFFDLHQEEIDEIMAESYAGALETALMGGPRMDPQAAGMSEIQVLFKKYLESEEIAQTATPGVPTRAALRGRSSRFKKPGAARGRRPSFIDTGLYESSFVAWMSK